MSQKEKRNEPSQGSIFTRRPGSTCLSLQTNSKSSSSTGAGSSRRNIFNSNVDSRLPTLPNGMKGNEDEDEFTKNLVPPRPYRKHRRDQDAYDLHDTNAPRDLSVEKPSSAFMRLSKEAVRDQVPKEFMTPLVADSGVRKRILLEGLTSDDDGDSSSVNHVADGYRVWFHYETYVDKGDTLDLLDTTMQHRIATSLQIGQDGLPGMYFGLLSMRKKEIAEFYLEPKYAYGKGIPFYIEPDQPIRVIIELADISVSKRKPVVLMNEIEKESVKLTFNEIMEEVQELITAGNLKFKKELYRDACDRYNWALDLLKEYREGKYTEIPGPQLAPEEEAIERKCFQLYSNLAICYNKVDEFKETEKVCKAAEKLLYLDGNLKSKVLYRYATAMLNLKKLEEAESLCKRGYECGMSRVEFQILMDKIKIELKWKKLHPEEYENMASNDEEAVATAPEIEETEIKDDLDVEDAEDINVQISKLALEAAKQLAAAQRTSVSQFG